MFGAIAGKIAVAMLPAILKFVMMFFEKKEDKNKTNKEIIADVKKENKVAIAKRDRSAYTGGLAKLNSL